MLTELRELEESLLAGPARSSREQLEQILDENFFEFGASGRVWTRDAIIDMLVDEPPSRRTMSNFTARSITPDIAHVTYTTSRRDDDGTVHHAHRCSIWIRRDSGWRLYFNQGTPFEPPTPGELRQSGSR